MDPYSTTVLLGVREGMEPVVSYFRDKFFRVTVTHDAENIQFDEVTKRRSIAPFVSPLVKGKVREKRGFVTKVFKPAYVKPKDVIRPTDTIKRLPGEQLNGTLSMGERRDIHTRNALRDQEESITRREEVMCVEALRLGQTTVSGEGYPTQVVNYLRNAAHRIVLTAGARWTEATATPLDDLDDMARLIRDNSMDGQVPTEVYFGVDVWDDLKRWLRTNDKDALALLLSSQHRGQTTEIQMGPGISARSGPSYEGRLGKYECYTYSDTYHDDDGNLQQVFPADEVMMATQGVDGVRNYGAIMDLDAGESGMAVMERFPKMWREPEPSAEYVMTQSAPLMVPVDPNATASMKVR